MLDVTIPELLAFIAGDFEAAWDSVASNPQPGHRGNFMFARQVMCLLEVACRLCKADKSAKALDNLSAALASRDRRYFTVLPGPCWCPSPRTRAAFELPSRGPNPDAQLLAALFNLIRNGQAHQYQQMGAVLADGKQFRFSLTGAEFGTLLEGALSAGRRAQHLAATADGDGNIWMTVRTDVLFIDVRGAIDDIGLAELGLAFDFMVEDRPETFDFTGAAVESVLKRERHWL